MTVFWLVVALLLAGALLLLLPALVQPGDPGVSDAEVNLAVHRDQWRETERDRAAGQLSPEHFAQSRQELQRRVVDEVLPSVVAQRPPRPAWRTAGVLAVVLPLATVLTYLKLGRPDAVAPGDAAPVPQATGDNHAVTPEQIARRVASLAERLQARPDDAEGWLMLGRSYTALGRYRDAALAWRKAGALLPPDATRLADLADVVAMAQNKRLAGEPAQLVQQALDLDPTHAKALALAGSVAFEARDYAAARGYWERLLAVVPADAPLARAMQGSIARAAQLEGAASVPAVSPAVSTAVAAAPSSPGDAGAAAIEGEIAVSAELAGRIAAGDTLFVFARAVDGPRMPLAVLRRPAQAEPLRFRLDDAMAMSPQLKLSAFPRVIVGARISRSAGAMPQPGDLVGQSGVVVPGAGGLRIVIDRVQP